MSVIKNSEVNRRVRETFPKENCTSVAIIGLAISVGASSLLLPGQGDEAKAADSVGADTTTTKVSEAANNPTTVSPTTKEQSFTANPSTPSALELSLFADSTRVLPAMVPFVLPGQSDWQVSKDYHVNALDPTSYKPADIVLANPQNVATFPGVAKNEVSQPTPPASPSIISSKAGTLSDRDQKSSEPNIPPVVIPTSSTTKPHPSIDQAKTQAVWATPKLLTPAIPQTQGAAAVLSQVKPEDKLDARAQSHSVSSNELDIAISSTSAISPSLVATTSPVAIPPKAATIANTVHTSYQPPAWSDIPRLPDPIVEPQAPSPAGIYNIQPEEILNARVQPSNAQPIQANQLEDSNRNLYTQRLRDKVIQMQEKYWMQGQDRPKPIANQAISNTTLTASASTSYKESRSSQYVNPEFNPNLRNQALPGGNRSTQKKQAVEQPYIPIKVPVLNASPRTMRWPLAAVPASTGDSYNPMVQPPVGKTVSPQFRPPDTIPSRYTPSHFNGYIWPAKGVLTSGYGMRWGRMHKGIDIAAPIGTPVVAAADGVVTYASWNAGGYGNLVEIQHPDGSTTRYAHNNRILVREGQQVTQGQQIAQMGNTGHSTGPHCHFEVHPGGQEAVNPIAFLPRRINSY